MDTYIENDCLKCIGCRGCSAVCPEGLIYISEFKCDGDVSYHLHTTRDYIGCHHCTKKFTITPPCQDVCPENCIKITRW